MNAALAETADMLIDHLGTLSCKRHSNRGESDCFEKRRVSVGAMANVIVISRMQPWNYEASAVTNGQRSRQFPGADESRVASPLRCYSFFRWSPRSVLVLSESSFL
jgi:hypothetical protein